MSVQPTNLPRVTYSNTGEDFSGVHAHLDEIMGYLCILSFSG